METDRCQQVSLLTYTVEDIAIILGVSVRQAYYICKETTDFRVISLGKKCIRVHRESFDAWFNMAGA